MAGSIATVSVADQNHTGVFGKFFYAIGTFAVQANPATYTTGGIPASLAHALIKADRTPLFVFVQGLTGYLYIYIPGTTATNGLLKIFVQDAVAQDALQELTNNSAIPAAVSGDTITFFALFNGML